MRRLAPISFVMLVSFQLHAAELDQGQRAGLSWEGIWEGSIGNARIVACLDKSDENGGENSGYYYLRHGVIIPLAKTESDADNWVEGAQGNPTGKWTLDPATANSLDGVWRNPKNKQALPIHLTRAKRIVDKKSDFWFAKDICHGVSFFRPIAEGAPLKKGEPRSFKGKRYRIITMEMPLASDKGLTGPAINSVELLESGPNIDAMNRILRERYLNRLARHYVTERGGLAEFFEDVVGVTDSRLTLDEMEWTAGYGISGSRRWTEVWDLTTLKLISAKDQDTRPDPDPEPANSQ